MKLSKGLSESLEKYEYFVPIIDSYSVWSRQRNGVPSHYKCFLGSRAMDLEEREYVQSLPLLTDEEAGIIDLAAAKVTSKSRLKKQLFDLLVLSGWDCVDVFFSFPYLKRLMRANHEKYSIPILEAKRRELIEAVRTTLILFEDVK